MTVVVVAIAAVIVILAAFDALPKIIRARADARLQTHLRYSIEDVAAAVLVAIERTDADVGPELAERMARTVIEDLENGVIGPELRTPPQ